MRNRRRGLAGVRATAIVVGGIRLGMTATPIWGYRVLDDYNIAVQIVGIRAQWRSVAVEETDSTVTVSLQEIWIHGPAFDDELNYVAIRLHDPLGTRTLVDGATGNRILLLSQ